MMDLLTPGMPDEAFTSVLGASGAPIVGLGRGPEPLHKELAGRHVVNAPRLGTPGSGHTGYAVITTEARVEVAFRSLPYDAGRTAREAALRGLPAEIVSCLPFGNHWFDCPGGGH